MRKILFLSLILVILTGCIKKPDFEFTVQTKNESKEEEIVETPIVKPEEPVGTTLELSPTTKSSEQLEQLEQAPAIEQKTVKDKTNQNNIENTISATIDWPVPFAMQAPFSNWDMPYQEMCEEAALVLVSKYYNKEVLDKSIMDQELTKIRNWESEKWGIYTDSTATEIKEMGEAIFNLNIEISEDVSVENIKNSLRKNYLVLVPTAGRELHNPYFKQPGPLYHILVLRGFTDNSFISNDVGIGKGEAYQYKFQTVINATHDLPILEDGTIFRPFDVDISDDLKTEEMKTGVPRILIIKGKK
ncbi:MAG: hypothetical protein UT32_C0013G0013 [Parcubacteria group bacterium GW2011_GWC2_39_14]|nr:MAG: hypothetical protein UT32_C0013G0013 [Parcubacteria group bacterium GW2011_GWC2_39_14]KKR54501.1 MAG: hypothetical protein UT91_C0014G0013 [Parcubacteria group bacterium GW2011_GWA2_40_23]